MSGGQEEMGQWRLNQGGELATAGLLHFHGLMPGWEWKASGLVLHLTGTSLTLLHYFTVSLVEEESGVTARAKLKSYSIYAADMVG